MINKEERGANMQFPDPYCFVNPCNMPEHSLPNPVNPGHTHPAILSMGAPRSR